MQNKLDCSLFYPKETWYNSLLPFSWLFVRRTNSEMYIYAVNGANHDLLYHATSFPGYLLVSVEAKLRKVFYEKERNLVVFHGRFKLTIIGQLTG